MAWSIAKKEARFASLEEARQRLVGRQSVGAFRVPPTPIAMPGRGAVRAALHPADASAVYFVARGDGSHKFSETLEEHNRAVIKYQLGGKPRPFSSYRQQKK